MNNMKFCKGEYHILNLDDMHSLVRITKGNELERFNAIYHGVVVEVKVIKSNDKDIPEGQIIPMVLSVDSEPINLFKVWLIRLGLMRSY